MSSRPRFLRRPAVVLLLAVGACAQGGGDPSAALRGPEWVVEDIAGRGIVDESRVTLNFEADGSSGGKGSCNTYGAGYTTDGNKIAFEQPFSTMMACAEALMNQERAFFDLLPLIRRFDIAVDGALVLTAEDGRTITARR